MWTKDRYTVLYVQYTHIYWIDTVDIQYIDCWHYSVQYSRYGTLAAVLSSLALLFFYAPSPVLFCQCVEATDAGETDLCRMCIQRSTQSLRVCSGGLPVLAPLHLVGCLPMNPTTSPLDESCFPHPLSFKSFDTRHSRIYRSTDSTVIVPQRERQTERETEERQRQRRDDGESGRKSQRSKTRKNRKEKRRCSPSPLLIEDVVIRWLATGFGRVVTALEVHQQEKGRTE